MFSNKCLEKIFSRTFLFLFIFLLSNCRCRVQLYNMEIEVSSNQIITIFRHYSWLLFLDSHKCFQWSSTILNIEFWFFSKKIINGNYLMNEWISLKMWDGVWWSLGWKYFNDRRHIIYGVIRLAWWNPFSVDILHGTYSMFASYWARP